MATNSQQYPNAKKVCTAAIAHMVPRNVEQKSLIDPKESMDR